MLNRKSILNTVYAFSLIGLIVSCFSVLNEIFQILQINKIEIHNTYTLKGSDFWETFLFYLLLLLIGLFFSAVLTMRMWAPAKLPACLQKDRWLAVGALVLIVLPFVYGILIRSYSRPYYSEFIQSDGYHYYQYFEYLLLYTFRSVAMTMAAYLGVIFGCNRIACKTEAAEADAE